VEVIARAARPVAATPEDQLGLKSIVRAAAELDVLLESRSKLVNSQIGQLLASSSTGSGPSCEEPAEGGSTLNELSS